MNVETLQEKLEAKAKKEATVRMEAVMQAIPYFREFRVSVSHDGVKIVRAKVDGDELRAALKEAIHAAEYPEILRRLTDELIEHVNAIDELRNELTGGR